MTRVMFGLTVCLALAGALAAGYWLGQQRAAAPMMAAAPAATAIVPAVAAERRIAYYRHPDGKPEYSPTPKQDEQGRDFVAVYEEAETPAAPTAKTASRGQGRVLYYRHPMGLPDTSPGPKKDSMGMDYIAVYENEQADDGNTVTVSVDRVQRLGVRTETVMRRNLMQSVRAVGTVQIDERRQFVVTTKFDGFIERLLVNTTGQPVRRGQVLMEIYSPELVQAQQEYLVAADALRDLGGAGDDTRLLAQSLVDGAIQRLRNWDMPEDDISRLRRERAASRRIGVRAPASGVIVDKKAVEGMRIMAGEPLYRIVDLSQMWVLADVFEQDLALVAPGQAAQIEIKAYPGRPFAGKVAFIYPHVERETRTAKVRIELANPDLALKADMYASVELAAPVGAAALAVPESAVLDSGTRQIVLIERGAGRFEPRPVRLGAKGGGYIEVLDGIAADERVVVSANFLIDAESNLRAALRAFTAPDSQEAPK